MWLGGFHVIKYSSAAGVRFPGGHYSFLYLVYGCPLERVVKYNGQNCMNVMESILQGRACSENAILEGIRFIELLGMLCGVNGKLSL
jgi:hypothetical protein